MILKKKVKINNEYGLHARPVSALVKLSQKFDSNLTLHTIDEHKKADCKSVISLLLLGANKGTELILNCSGHDAPTALEEISNLFNRNFDE